MWEDAEDVLQGESSKLKNNCYNIVYKIFTYFRERGDRETEVGMKATQMCL